MRRGRRCWSVNVVFALALLGCASPAPPPRLARVPRVPVEAAEPHAPIEVRSPSLPPHATCNDARSAYREIWASGTQRADLTTGQLGSVLAHHGYFSECRVPDRFGVSICAAVQNGRVLGATVRTAPRAPMLERCIDRGVRSLSFPEHPRMDVTTTVFRPGP